MSQNATSDALELQLQSDVEEIRQSGLFDPDWYLDSNWDVIAAGLDPARHYVEHGFLEGRDPTEDFSTAFYLEAYPSVRDAGMNPFVHFIRHGREAGLRTTWHDPEAPIAPAAGPKSLRPLPIFQMPGQTPAVHMVTDSISPNSLFGGVATAIVFSALLARKLDRPLSILTRDAPADANAIRRILDVQGVEFDGDVDFTFIDADLGRFQPVSAKDVFVTTSWWTTVPTIKSVAKERVFYILQEDERMFYPYGDERLMAEQTMNDPDLTYVVNTKFLREHLARDGLASGRLGHAFEPSFPAMIPANEKPAPRDRYRLMFHARPNHPRNLYEHGVRTLNRALEKGIIDPKDWEIVFVGAGAEPIELSGGVRPTIQPNLTWNRYRDVIRSVDVALSLMYTPHPSYPPVDVAAVGGVVVTNSFGVKQSLDTYCENIICSDLDVDNLAEALRRAMTLAKDTPARSRNFKNAGIGRDWNRSFAAALSKVEATHVR